MTRTHVISELKKIVASPASVSLHLVFSLVAAALILLLERK